MSEGWVVGQGRNPDGAGHAPDVPAGYKRTEVGVIPEEWNTCTMGDLFAFKNGLNKAKRFFGVGTPIVNYMDVFERSGLTADNLVGRVTLTPDEIRNYQVRMGDVFFTRTSETVEEIGVASVMLDDPCDTVFSGFILRARPRYGHLNDTYKQYCFAVRSVRSQIVSNATYTTRALTNGNSLSGVHIAVPPIPEQLAIAAALSDVDELIGSLEALIAKKRDIKQASMQQLLTGRTRLPGFGGEWEARRIGKLADVDPENLPSSTDPGLLFNYISLDHVNAGRLLGYSGESFETAPSRARRIVRTGDVLMSTVRPALQGHLLFSDQARNAVCSTGFAVLRSKRNHCEPQFLFAHLFGDVVSAQVQTLLAGSNYPAINSGDVGRLRVSCPPTLAEQQAIATTLADMDDEIAALEHRLDKTRAIKQGMMQQLLTGTIRLPIPNDDTEGDHAYDA